MASFLGEKFYLFSYVLSHYISRGPGCLQIEAAGDGIDVEHFAGKEEVRAHLALQGMQVDVVEADTAAGNKLFFEGSLAVHLIEVVGEGFYQQVATLLSHFARWWKRTSRASSSPTHRSSWLASALTISHPASGSS